MGRAAVVVVGAGSAGAALAARLSDDPARHVLLLEAGPDHDSAGTPPALAGNDFAAAVAEPGRTWPDLVVRRTDAQEPRLYLRGRGVGGSSAINAMLAIRGLPADYDRWAALGAAGWGWAELRPVFEGLERPYVTTEADCADVDRALRTAALAAGHPWAGDYDAPGSLGVSPAKLTWTDGRRRSTNDTHLEPARGRPNLVVRGHALVDRALLEGRRAAGVRLAGGEEIEAGEVVLCAGAIHSPAVLLRSGVERPGIGGGLKDHPSVQVLLARRGPAATGGFPFATVLRWSSSGTVEADLQLLAMAHAGADTEMAMVMAAVMRVESVGRVTLRSADPTIDPEVDFRLLSDERDLARLRRATRHLAVLLAHPSWQDVVTGPALGISGDPLDPRANDDELDRWLLANVGDYVHAAGTCRMGAPDDPSAVVDPRARVIGYEGLRVADASVFPDLPRANTHLSAVAVGERTAALMATGG